VYPLVAYILVWMWHDLAVVRDPNVESRLRSLQFLVPLQRDEHVRGCGKQLLAKQIRSSVVEEHGGAEIAAKRVGADHDNRPLNILERNLVVSQEKGDFIDRVVAGKTVEDERVVELLGMLPDTGADFDD